MSTKRERELQREAEELQRQIAELRRGPIVLELGFDASPAPPTSRAQRLAQVFRPKLPPEFAQPTPEPRAASTPAPARPKPRTPRGPITPGMWLSEKSRRAQSGAGGIRNRAF